jgi:hypothetical protein
VSEERQMKVPNHNAVSNSEAAPRSTMRGDSIAQACLAFMREMEASLEASQAALLALDVAATERCTNEQVRLRQCMEALLSGCRLASARNSKARHLPEQDLKKKEDLKEEGSKEKEFGWNLPPCTPEMAERLRAASERIQKMARVQAALLRRARQFLCVLSNIVAGTEAVYGQRIRPSWPGFAEPAERK